MNICKYAILSVLLGCTLASAKIRVEGITYNNIPLKVASELILCPNETKTHFYDDVRMEVTLTETNIIVFDLAKKNEKNSFVSFYRTAIISPDKEIEIGFGATNGFSLVLHIIEIKE